jgi:hypothetical protein
MFGQIIYDSPIKKDSPKKSPFIEVGPKIQLEPVNVKKPLHPHSSSSNLLGVYNVPNNLIDPTISENLTNSLNEEVEDSLRTSQSSGSNLKRNKARAESTYFERLSEQSSECGKAITPVAPATRCNSIARTNNKQSYILLEGKRRSILKNSKHISFYSRGSQSPPKVLRSKNKMLTP